MKRSLPKRALEATEDLAFAYYREAFLYYIRSGILHPEIHILLSRGPEHAENLVQTIYRAYQSARETEPDFVVSVIGAGKKHSGADPEQAKLSFLSTLSAAKAVQDTSDSSAPQPFVIGFDLVNEEDASRPLREFAPMLLEFKENHTDFGLFMHSGENLYPESDNLMDAYLLGVSRVGHGLNLYRYPNLLKRFADEEICLECCPISNQALGYTRDLRLHPGLEYLKRGVAIALCSDDPVFLEHETLTDDFFAAVVSWNLTLADVKQLCLNSITYCALDPERKRKLLRAWNRRWLEFVASMLTGLIRFLNF